MLVPIEKPAVAEYLILIEVRKDLSEKILEVKKAFSQKFKTEEPLKIPPNIGLVKYSQYVSFESRIQQKLQSLSEQSAPFSVALQQFGALPSHTIFINVSGKSGIQFLVKNIRTHLQSLLKKDKDNKPLFIMEPYIPIAQKLKPWQYEQSWPQYHHRSFSGTFIATEMTLLKKDEYSTVYHRLKKFSFQNIQARPIQSMLF